MFGRKSIDQLAERQAEQAEQAAAEAQARVASGSFLNGLVVGFLTGATGYFLFGTSRGQKLRQDLAKEWEHAKGDLVKQGVLVDPAGKLDQIASAAVPTLKEFCQQLYRQIKTGTLQQVAKDAKTKATQMAREAQETATKVSALKSAKSIKSAKPASKSSSAGPSVQKFKGI